jgi:hypothetical protein
LFELILTCTIKFEGIEGVECGIYKATIDVLELAGVETIHQSKFSMGFALAIDTKYEKAGITDLSEETLQQKDLLEFKIMLRWF